MTKFLIGLTSLILAFVPLTAGAQQVCMPYAELVAVGAKEYNEIPAIEFELVNDPNTRIVIMVAPDKHTATALAVQTRAGEEIACVVATGENARKPLPPKPPGRAS